MNRCFLIRPLSGEIIKTVQEYNSLYFLNRSKRMRKLMSKGNGRNYYGWDSKGMIHEIVRQGGRFYRTKVVIGEGLRIVGNPLKKEEFTLEE